MLLKRKQMCAMTITVSGFHFSSTLIHKSWNNLLSPQIFALWDLAILINLINLIFIHKRKGLTSPVFTIEISLVQFLQLRFLEIFTQEYRIACQHMFTCVHYVISQNEVNLSELVKPRNFQTFNTNLFTGLWFDFFC